MKRIVILAENTAQNPNCIAEHGLSIYIETAKHKLLLDAGSSDALLHNANVLGIDLTRVDTLILSHGHYDHSGGILPFAKINPNAKIYMQRTALEDYYHGERYIGIDKQIAALPQLVLLDGDFTLDAELALFTNVTGRRFWPKSNVGLTKRMPLRHGSPDFPEGVSQKAPLSDHGALSKSQHRFSTRDAQDMFLHEQCLVITRGNRRILLSGCAHNGILNILDKYHELYHSYPQTVISGFHMMKKNGDYTPEEAAIITDTARELAKLDIKFYTGHCTGQPAYDMMKVILGEKLQPISTGIGIR